MKAVESQLKDTTSVHKLTECLTCKRETLTAKTIQSRPVEAVGSEQDAVRTCLSAQFGNFRLSVKAVSCASCWRAER